MKGNCEKCSGAKAQLRSRRDVRGPIDKKEMGELSTPASVGNNESPWLSRTTSPYFSENTVTSLFYCPALSGCNRQGRKRGKIKFADVSNLSNSSPLKISAGVRCDPSIPARLITQRDKLL